MNRRRFTDQMGTTGRDKASDRLWRQASDWAIWSVASTLCLCIPAASNVYGQDADLLRENKAMAETIADFHSGHSSDRLLHVVYFHPSDVEPQKDFSERITRIMLDIQSFYATEMKRHGFGKATFPLDIDKASGLVRLHMVKGKMPAKSYTYESGNQVAREVRQRIASRVDAGRETLLIFNGMCRDWEDGDYFFHAPYYGSGGPRRGVCHVADCEVMDTKHFTNVTDRIKYKEHYREADQTLATFNNFYIGGVAHELGHALGINHCKEKPWERERLGNALMGSGNFTYRRELQGGGKKGSHLLRSTAVQLASHPLFTRSSHQLAAEVNADIEGLRFEARGGWLHIKGRVVADVNAYAVIAFTNPEIDKGWQNQDYDAYSWISPVEEDRSFSIIAKVQPPGRSGLRLSLCHLNGLRSNYEFEYEVNGLGNPSDEGMNEEWAITRVEKAFLKSGSARAIELAEQMLPSLKGTSAEPVLQHLITLSDDRNIKDIASVGGDTFFLSDSNWKSAKVGWGQPARDQYFVNDQIRDKLFLRIGNKFYVHGLYAHAPSTYAFDLGGRWERFEATAGLQHGAGGEPEGVFIVNVDGKEAYRSEKLKGSATEDISIDITDANEIELIAESGRPGNARCWTIWGDARVRRDEQQQAAESP